MLLSFQEVLMRRKICSQRKVKKRWRKKMAGRQEHLDSSGEYSSQEVCLAIAPYCSLTST
jgi:hypothetical protein